jgi:hypothetical protein
MTVDTTSGSGFAGGDAVEAGLERARQHGIYSSRSEIRNELDALTRVVQEWPEELSTRFVELITEQVTVASVARRYYGDPHLDDESIRSYISHSVAFFNSWRHR